MRGPESLAYQPAKLCMLRVRSILSQHMEGELEENIKLRGGPGGLGPTPQEQRKQPAAWMGRGETRVSYTSNCASAGGYQCHLNEVSQTTRGSCSPDGPSRLVAGCYVTSPRMPPRSDGQIEAEVALSQSWNQSPHSGH